MTATAPNPLFQSALQLPELLALFERAVHGTIEKWEKLCAGKLRAGDSDSLQALRQEYEAILSGQLKMLDGCLQAAGRHAGEEAAESHARLTALRDQLGTHYDTFFPKWQTVEDLEDIVLARMTPSNEALKALAAKSPPPQSWYDEVWEDAP